MATKAHFYDPREIELVKEVFGDKENRFNPRTLTNPGFSLENMDRLREAIQKDGLNHALLIRLGEDKRPKLVAGERRLRAILGLLEQDEAAKKNGEPRILCKNIHNKKMEPALEVYGKHGVECKITDEKDEKEFLRQAIQENTLHESLTDYELLLQCKKMEDSGFTRTEQSQTMGMSEAWISQSHSLLQAPSCVLDFLEKGLLARTAALTFLDVEDEKVESVLNQAINLTYKAAQDKQKQAEQDLENAENDLAHGEKILRLSQFTGNHDGNNKAKRQIARAGKAKKKAEQALESAKESQNKKITVETINQAAREVNAAEHLNKPQAMKQVRLIACEIGDLLKASNGDTLVRPDTEDKFSRKDISLVHRVLEWVLNRNYCKHPLDVIQMK